MGTGSVVLPVWPVVRLEFQAFRTASKLCEVVLSSDVPVPSDCGPNLCEHCRVLSWPRPKIVQSLYDPTSLSKFGPFSVGKFRLLSMRRPRLESDRLSWVLPVPQSARLTNALSRNELEASLTRIQDTVWLDCCHLNTLPRFLSVHHKNHWLEGGVAGPDQLFMHLCMVILFQLVSNSINQRCWWDDTQFCWSQGRDNILDQTLSPHVFEPRASCTIWPRRAGKAQGKVVGLCLSDAELTIHICLDFHTLRRSIDQMCFSDQSWPKCSDMHWEDSQQGCRCGSTLAAFAATSEDFSHSHPQP